MKFLICGIIAYLLGSISFSIIFTKIFAHVDVRSQGSGNAGTTNVLRVAGKLPALLTLVCDILKGVLAVLIAYFIGKAITKSSDNETAMLIELAGLLVIIGHTFPIFFKFRGGKGVATAIGVLLTVNWKIGLIVIIYGVLIIALTKMVSLGSVAGALLLPILCIFLKDNFLVSGNRYINLIWGILVALFVIYNHRENIKRLRNGSENQINFHKPIQK